MGKLTILDLIVYILKFLWFVAEPLVELLLCIMTATYEQLSRLHFGTQIVVIFLLMGIGIMLISPFHSQMDPRLYPSPFELETYQIHKPVIDDNDDWNKMYLDRTENILEGKKEMIHFIVRLTSDTAGTKSIEANETRLKEETGNTITLRNTQIIEKTSKDALPQVHVIDRIEKIEKELLVVEPVEED